MSVPIELVGAFRRSGLLWKGNRVVDYIDALWLQTPEWFADIRLPIPGVVIPDRPDMPAFFGRSNSFAGHGTYEAPQFTWNHEIGLRPSTGLDSNPLVWDNGVVLECGRRAVDGEEHPFVEEWLRMTADDVTWSATGDATSARIEVGKWAIEIHDDRPSGIFESVRYDLTPDGWVRFGAFAG